nr:NAD(P)H-dependent oxidoreductase [Methanosphaera stadtmanae]
MLDDDMQDIKRKITDCDAIILVAPIYFSQINAQATVFINRLYSFFQTEYVQKYENGYVVSVNDFNDFEIINSDKLKNIKISIILTQGEKDTTDTEKYIESGLFNQLNLLFDVKDVEILPDNNEPGIVKDKKDQIEVIEKVAKNLITQ